MRPPQKFYSAGVLYLAALVLAGCSEAPTGSADLVHAHHDPATDPLLAADASPEVRRKIADLRRWSAQFHNLEKAAAAGYDFNFACIDETTAGVDAATARGMGHHVTFGDFSLIADGEVHIDQPEFLVFAPHPNEAELPPEERLGAARLVGFDYYLPGSPTDTPPEFFGEPFNWSPTFQGWVRHIYLWGHNPEGMFEDYNAATPLCADPLRL